MGLIQYDLFLKEKKEIETKMKVEAEASMKSQIRLLMHRSANTEMRVEKIEEILNKIVDYLLDEEPMAK